MSSQHTSQKHKDFVREPIFGKPIDAIAGVGAVYGEKLKEKGFEKASNLLGQFLCMSRDVAVFGAWLMREFNFSPKHAEDAANCLVEWCDINL